MNAVDLDLDAERLVDVLTSSGTMTSLDVALELADIGVPVLPTVPGDKAPLLTVLHVEGVDKQGERIAAECSACKTAHLTAATDHGATIDLDVIRRYWSVHPDAGVGMKNHPRLVRGDGDYTDREAFRRSRKQIGYGQPYGAPEPFSGPTPGGQYRRRFLHLLPADVPPPGGGTKVLGVSWYGSSGYVVVKGGHPNGGSYAPFTGDRITELPETLAVAFRRRTSEGGTAAKAVTTEKVSAFLELHTDTQHVDRLAWRRKVVADAEAGERHLVATGQLRYAFREAVAGWYPARLAHDAIHTALGEAGWDDSRLNGDEWDGIVAWAIGQVATLDRAAAIEQIADDSGERAVKHLEDGYDPAYIDWIVNGGDNDTRDLTIAELAELMAGASFDSPGEPDDDTPIEPGRFRRWSITELLAADLTFEWDVTGMLVRPTYGIDTGELKTLKSYFGTARAVGLAAGVPVLGHWTVPERRRVLFYVAEGGRIPFTRRLIRLAEAHGLDPADLDGWLEPIFDAGPLDSTTFRDTLRGHLTEFGPSFVHLDPLYAFQSMQVDAHRVDQQGRMLSEVQNICAEHDATLWITAHMNQTGTGFDLKRIAGAGTGEWGDSWVLLKHRETPDVGDGRFRLAVDIGSRQWGGATYDLDLNIGRFDADSGSHDGPITFNVRRAGDDTDAYTDVEVIKRLKARRAVFAALRKARKPLTRTEIAERSTGAPNTYIRAEISVLIDEHGLVEHGIRKPDKGGKEAPLYVLGEGWGDD